MALPDLRDVTHVRAGWDVRIVWNVERALWWWNAWQESTATELSGFAQFEEDAQRDVSEAIARNVVVPIRRESGQR